MAEIREFIFDLYGEDDKDDGDEDDDDNEDEDDRRN